MFLIFLCNYGWEVNCWHLMVIRKLCLFFTYVIGKVCITAYNRMPVTVIFVKSQWKILFTVKCCYHRVNVLAVFWSFCVFCVYLRFALVDNNGLLLPSLQKAVLSIFVDGFNFYCTPLSFQCYWDRFCSNLWKLV